MSEPQVQKVGRKDSQTYFRFEPVLPRPNHLAFAIIYCIHNLQLKKSLRGLEQVVVSTLIFDLLGTPLATTTS